MSILPRMKLKNKIADMWIGQALLAGDLNLCSADLGTWDLGGRSRISGHYRRVQKYANGMCYNE